MHASVAVGISYETTSGQAMVMSVGQLVNSGASTSDIVTVKVHSAVFPDPSIATKVLTETPLV